MNSTIRNWGIGAIVFLALLWLAQILPAGVQKCFAADEVVLPANAIVRDDFENCTPADKIKIDENVDGCWKIRIKDWSTKLLISNGDNMPDLTYDPKLKGKYDIYVETRATHWNLVLGIELASDKDFTVIAAPTDKASETYHYNAKVLFRKAVKLDNEKLVIRKLDTAVYLESLIFVPVQ